jgi:putative restriction endonuclease
LKGIFDTKRDSGYKDDVAFKYHFPKQYRRTAETLVGDWIVYREPQRNGGRRAYVATAKVVAIEDDPKEVGHAYAVMAEYQEFDEPVPFVRDGRYWETSLLSVADPTRVGAFLQGKSIRVIPETDFGAIAQRGFPRRSRPITPSVWNLIRSMSTAPLRSFSISRSSSRSAVSSRY